MDDLFGTGSKKEPTFYQALGCDRNSSAEQITAEYRARVRSLHPDKLIGEADQGRNEEYLRLQSAYDTLSDEEERKCYDAWLDCLLPLTYDEFKRNKDAVKVSMHWVVPQQTPMISGSNDEQPPEFIESQRNFSSRWDSDRYQSETVRRFRNYEL
ncbi:hypothetical protein Q1695_005205 [Nippostrongylus brasiliensis]|nr:hypothetical protein Q1695_005205 [Nippostrongylus brasiliensis]